MNILSVMSLDRNVNKHRAALAQAKQKREKMPVRRPAFPGWVLKIKRHILY